MSEKKKTEKKKPAAKADTKAPEAKAEKTGDTAADAGGATDSPKSYSRGENQKPVSPQYRKNWDAIFGKKK